MTQKKDPSELSGAQVVSLIVTAIGGVALLSSKSFRNGDERAVVGALGAIGFVLGIAWFTFASQRAKQRATSAVGETVVEPEIPTADVIAEHPVIFPPQTTTQRDQEVDAPARPVRSIELVRELMGPTPRRFDPALDSYLTVQPPYWLVPRKTDEMLRVFSEQQRIRQEGKVVWAAVVQANKMIFQPGPFDLGASIIWSEDAFFDVDPNELMEIAHECYSLKGVDQVDPESAAFSRMLTNEMTRANGLPVPSRFTGGRKVFHSSLMLTRRHLPQGLLTRTLMPIWIDPNPTGMVLLVPAAYWPPSLTHWWKTMDTADS